MTSAQAITNLLCLNYSNSVPTLQRLFDVAEPEDEPLATGYVTLCNMLLPCTQYPTPTNVNAAH